MYACSGYTSVAFAPSTCRIFVEPLELLSISTGACGQCGIEEVGGGGALDPFNGRDASYDWALLSITIDLNIVYDPTQYTREQAEAATKKSLKDLQNTYAKIGVSFNVTYSEGTADASQVDQNGLPTRIATGAKENAVNAFLYVNNSAATKGRSGSNYNPQSQQIFLWEGSVDANPRASNVANRLSSGALAHEFGHLFLQYAGFPMTGTFLNNLHQDAGIAYALNQMRYNPFFQPDPELPDNFDYKRDVGDPDAGGPTKSGLPRLKSVANPSFEQLLRIGAKRVSSHLKK